MIADWWQRLREHLDRKTDEREQLRRELDEWKAYRHPCRDCFDYDCRIVDNELDAERADRRARRAERSARRHADRAVLLLADAEVTRAEWSDHRQREHPELFAGQVARLSELSDLAASESVWDPDSNGDGNAA